MAEPHAPVDRPAVPLRIGPPDAPIVVRRGTIADLEALTTLYARLGAEDRYRRFFSGGMPSRSTLERWLGGPGIVFVAEAGDEIVADAGAARSDTGQYELGIAVDPRHRGWLGPFLLDLVLTEAASLGAEAVMAEVLATNRPMLAMLASRGTAMMSSGDPSVVRLLLGTRQRVPGWPACTGPSRCRVLLELGAGGSAAADALADAGYDVVLCRGPAVTGASARRWRCPLLEGHPCPLIAGADVVVTADPSSEPRPSEVEVTTALPTVHPRARRVHLGARPTAAEVVDAVAQSDTGRSGP